MVYDSLHDLKIQDNIIQELLPILKRYLDLQPETSEKRILIQNLVQISPTFRELVLNKA